MISITAEVKGNGAPVGGEKVQQAAMVILALVRDLFPLGVACIWPSVRCTRQISAEGSGVEVPFIVRQRIVPRKPAKVHVIVVL